MRMVWYRANGIIIWLLLLILQLVIITIIHTNDAAVIDENDNEIMNNGNDLEINDNGVTIIEGQLDATVDNGKDNMDNDDMINDASNGGPLAILRRSWRDRRRRDRDRNNRDDDNELSSPSVDNRDSETSILRPFPPVRDRYWPRGLCGFCWRRGRCWGRCRWCSHCRWWGPWPIGDRTVERPPGVPDSIGPVERANEVTAGISIDDHPNNGHHRTIITVRDLMPLSSIPIGVVNDTRCRACRSDYTIAASTYLDFILPAGIQIQTATSNRDPIVIANQLKTIIVNNVTTPSRATFSEWNQRLCEPCQAMNLICHDICTICDGYCRGWNLAPVMPSDHPDGSITFPPCIGIIYAPQEESGEHSNSEPSCDNVKTAGASMSDDENVVIDGNGGQSSTSSRALHHMPTLEDIIPPPDTDNTSNDAHEYNGDRDQISSLSSLPPKVVNDTRCRACRINSTIAGDAYLDFMIPAGIDFPPSVYATTTVTERSARRYQLAQQLKSSTLTTANGAPVPVRATFSEWNQRLCGACHTHGISCDEICTICDGYCRTGITMKQQQSSVHATTQLIPETSDTEEEIPSERSSVPIALIPSDRAPSETPPSGNGPRATFPAGTDTDLPPLFAEPDWGNSQRAGISLDGDGDGSNDDDKPKPNPSLLTHIVDGNDDQRSQWRRWWDNWLDRVLPQLRTSFETRTVRLGDRICSVCQSYDTCSHICASCRHCPLLHENEHGTSAVTSDQDEDDSGITMDGSSSDDDKEDADESEGEPSSSATSVKPSRADDEHYQLKPTTRDTIETTTNKPGDTTSNKKDGHRRRRGKGHGTKSRSARRRLCRRCKAQKSCVGQCASCHSCSNKLHTDTSQYQQRPPRD